MYEYRQFISGLLENAGDQSPLRIFATDGRSLYMPRFDGKAITYERVSSLAAALVRGFDVAHVLAPIPLLRCSPRSSFVSGEFPSCSPPTSISEMISPPPHGSTSEASCFARLDPGSSAYSSASGASSVHGSCAPPRGRWSKRTCLRSAAAWWHRRRRTLRWQTR